MKKKIIIFGGIGVGLTVVGFLIKNYVKNRNEKNTLNLPNVPTRKGHPIVETVCPANDVFPLKQQKGFKLVCAYSNVKRFQRVLNAKSPAPLLPIKEDGKFGKNTKLRLKRIFDVEVITEDLYNREVSLYAMPDLLKNVVFYT